MKFRPSRIKKTYEQLMNFNRKEILLFLFASMDKYNLFYFSGLFNIFTKEQMEKNLKETNRLNREIIKNLDYLTGKKEEIEKLQKAKLCYLLSCLENKAFFAQSGYGEYSENWQKMLDNIEDDFYKSLRISFYSRLSGFKK